MYVSCAHRRAVRQPTSRDPREHWVAALEAPLRLERVRRELRADVVDGQGGGRGLDGDLHVAIGAPPQRAEEAAFAPVGQEPVAQPRDRLAFDLVAIALLALLAVGPPFAQRLGVGERYGGAGAAARHDLRVGRREVSAIERGRHLAAGRHRPARGAGEQRRRGRGPLGTGDAREPLLAIVHVRDRARHEEPPRGRVADAPRRGRADLVHARPVVVVEPGALPAPRVARGVDLLAHAADVGLGRRSRRDGWARATPPRCAWLSTSRWCRRRPRRRCRPGAGIPSRW